MRHANPQRVTLENPLFGFEAPVLHVLPRHRGENECGRYEIDSDFPRRQFDGQRLDEACEPRLAGAVSREPLTSGQTENATDVGNGTRRLQEWKRLSSHFDGGPQVYIELPRDFVG